MEFLDFPQFLRLIWSNELFSKEFEDFLVDSDIRYEFAMLCMGGEL